MDYPQYAVLFKALSDSNRLKILMMLSEGELCACRILEELSITQPTLSHHMGILCGCGLVNCRQEGKWMHYSINPDKVQKIMELLGDIIKKDEHE